MVQIEAHGVIHVCIYIYRLPPLPTTSLRLEFLRIACWVDNYIYLLTGHHFPKFDFHKFAYMCSDFLGFPLVSLDVFFF